MSEITPTKVELTVLQEDVLIEFNKTTNHQFICKKLNIKQISLTKTLQALTLKGLLENDNLTLLGKQTINYLKFKSDTIKSFLNKSNLEENKDLINQLSKLDFQIIVAIKNLLNN